MTTIWPVRPIPSAAAAEAALLRRSTLRRCCCRHRRRSPTRPVTCWPVVRSTEATVPEMVEVREASLRLVCAVDSEDSADVTDASSESTAGAAPDASSLESRSSAAVSWAWAAVTSSDRAVVSTVASTCPAVTVWPALTFDRGHRARDGEVQIGLAGRLERPRTGHRLLDGARS